MRIFLSSLVLAGVWPALALAESCPPPPDHSVAFARLVEQVRNAQSQTQARTITNEMWALWADAPNEQAQSILDRGMTRRAGFDLAGALRDFDTLIAYCPAYAEGYNQRGFVHFIRQDYAAALADLDRAIALSPTHIGALSGRALTLIALGRAQEAQRDLRVAVDLNPWLPERSFLSDSAPAEPGSDL